MTAKNRKRTIIILIMAALLLPCICTMTVMAQGISEADAAGIYSGSQLYSPNSVNDFVKHFTEAYAHVQDDIAGATLGTLLVLLGDGLYIICSSNGLTITSAIYGRVGGALTAMNDLNVFSFEMIPGNFYGITAMAVYAQLRNMFVLIMACIVMWHMVNFIYSAGSQRERVRLIETVKRVIVVSLLLLVLPWVIDMMLYMRDSILYAEMGTCSETLKKFAGSLGVNGYSFQKATGVGGGADVAKVFRTEVSKSPTLTNSVFYFAAVLGCVYFFGVYVGYAITMMVLVIFFPFACAMELVKPGLLADWFKQLLGIIMIPVIDAAIMLLPLMCGVANRGSNQFILSFIELVMIWSVVPARGLVRQWLGLGSGNALEMSGVGAIMGVAKLATTVGGIIANPSTGIVAMAGKAGSDRKMASMYMDKARRADELSQDDAEEALHEMGVHVGADQTGRDILSSAAEKLKGVTGKTSAEKSMKRQEIIEDTAKQLGHEKSAGQEEIDDAMGKIAEYKTEAAKYRVRGEFLKNRVKLGESTDPEKDEADAAEAREKALQYEAYAASEQEGVAEKRGRVGLYDRSIRAAGGHGGPGYGRGAGGGSMDSGNRDFPEIDDYADINNFESPEMKGISYERRAELLRERARKNEHVAAARAVTSFAGGVAGLGAGMFGGQNMSMMTTAVGMEMGSYAAPYVTDKVEGIVQNMYGNGAGPAGNPAERKDEAPVGEQRTEIDENILDKVVLEKVRKKTQRVYDGGDAYSSKDNDVDVEGVNSQEEREVYLEKSEKVIEEMRVEYQKAVRDLNSTADGKAANDGYREEAMNYVVNAMPQIAQESGIDLQNLDASGWRQVMDKATAAYAANYSGLLVNESHVVPETVGQSQGSLAAFTLAAYDSIHGSSAELDYIGNALAKAGIKAPENKDK